MAYFKAGEHVTEAVLRNSHTLNVTGFKIIQSNSTHNLGGGGAHNVRPYAAPYSARAETTPTLQCFNGKLWRSIVSWRSRVRVTTDRRQYRYLKIHHCHFPSQSTLN
jgi:hypothetical protein